MQTKINLRISFFFRIFVYKQMLSKNSEQTPRIRRPFRLALLEILT